MNNGGILPGRSPSISTMGVIFLQLDLGIFCGSLSCRKSNVDCLCVKQL